MVGILCQLMATQELRPTLEPRLARQERHRVWPARGDRECLRGVLREQDRRNEDRLRKCAERSGLACAILRSCDAQLSLWRCCSACLSVCWCFSVWDRCNGHEIRRTWSLAERRGVRRGLVG